jgi:hypothetical protein
MSSSTSPARRAFAISSAIPLNKALFGRVCDKHTRLRDLLDIGKRDLLDIGKRDLLDIGKRHLLDTWACMR